MALIPYEKISDGVDSMFSKIVPILQTEIGSGLINILKVFVTLYIMWVCIKAMMGDHQNMKGLVWFVFRLLIILALLQSATGVMGLVTSLAKDLNGGAIAVFADKGSKLDYGSQTVDLYTQFSDKVDEIDKQLPKLLEVGASDATIIGPLINWIRETVVDFALFIYNTLGFILASMYFIQSLINNVVMMISIILLPFAAACSLFKTTQGIFAKWLRIMLGTILTSALLVLAMQIILKMNEFILAYITAEFKGNQYTSAVIAILFSGIFLFIIGMLLINKAKELAGQLNDATFESSFAQSVGSIGQSIGSSMGLGAGRVGAQVGARASNSVRGVSKYGISSAKRILGLKN